MLLGLCISIPSHICRWLDYAKYYLISPYLAPTPRSMLKVCHVHRWSGYLLGSSVLLLCTEQLGRSKCWDQSWGCPLLLLHSNPQAGLCRTWARCRCEIAQQQRSQCERCPSGSAVLCHEQRTWKKKGSLYPPAALQCGIKHAANGVVCYNSQSYWQFSDKLVRSKVSTMTFQDRIGFLRNWLLYFLHFHFFPKHQLRFLSDK